MCDLALTGIIGSFLSLTELHKNELIIKDKYSKNKDEFLELTRLIMDNLNNEIRFNEFKKKESELSY